MQGQRRGDIDIAPGSPPYPLLNDVSRSWGIIVTDAAGPRTYVRQLAQNTHLDTFHFKRAAFYNGIKSKVGLVLAKAAPFRITLNLDGAPIPSRACTHLSHNNNSRLISTALSHHVPLPHAHST